MTRTVKKIEKMIAEYKNSENDPELEITVLEFCIHSYQINHLDCYWRFHRNNLLFLKKLDSELSFN